MKNYDGVATADYSGTKFRKILRAAAASQKRKKLSEFDFFKNTEKPFSPALLSVSLAKGARARQPPLDTKK